MRKDRLGKHFGVCLNTASPAVSGGRLWTSAADTGPAHTVPDGRGAAGPCPARSQLDGTSGSPEPFQGLTRLFLVSKAQSRGSSVEDKPHNPEDHAARQLRTGLGARLWQDMGVLCSSTPGPAAPAPNPVPALALGRAVTTGLEAAEGGNGPRQGQLWTTLLRSLHESAGPGEVFAASLGLSWTCHQGSTGQTAPGGL